MCLQLVDISSLLNEKNKQINHKRLLANAKASFLYEWDIQYSEGMAAFVYDQKFLYTK